MCIVKPCHCRQCTASCASLHYRPTCPEESSVGAAKRKDFSIPPRLLELAAPSLQSDLNQLPCQLRVLNRSIYHELPLQICVLSHLQNLTRLSQLPVTSRMYSLPPSLDPTLLYGAQLTALQPSFESWINVACHSSFGWCCRILTRPSLDAHARIKPNSWGAHATLITYNESIIETKNTGFSCLSLLKLTSRFKYAKCLDEYAEYWGGICTRLRG